MSIEIYKVQSAALADGVYTCKQQCLLATGWEAGHGDKFEDMTATAWLTLTLYYVRKLVTNGGYTYRCLIGHTSGVFTDDLTAGKWILIPDLANVEVLNLVENDTLSTYTRALAVGDMIAAWVWIDCTGASKLVGIPITPSVRMVIAKESAPSAQQISCNLIANDGETEIESPIDVYCKVCPNSNLSEAQPRLATGDYLFVQNISGKWWCVTIFTGNEDCVCSTE